MHSNLSYCIKEINKSEFKGFDIYKCDNPKFLYENLNNEIKIYDHLETEVKFFDFFGKIFFKVEKENISLEKYNLKRINNELTSQDNEYHCFYISENTLTNGEISILLRGSTTLDINKKNSYENPDIKVVFSERAFLFINKFDKSQEDKFENILTLYLLSHAYNLYSEKTMNEIILFHKKNNVKDMLKKRKEVYSFNLSCYFSNPVKYNRHQLHNLWTYLYQLNFVNVNHQEIKSQMEDLINLVAIDRKEFEQKELEDQKRISEERYREEKKYRDERREDEEKKYRDEKTKKQNYRDKLEKQYWEEKKYREDIRAQEESRYREEKKYREDRKEQEERRLREEKNKKESYKEEEERRYREEEHLRELENKQFNKKAEKLTKITIVIAVFSLFSLIGAYKDFKDLGWNKYVVKKYKEFEKIDKVKYLENIFADVSKKIKEL